MKKIISMLLTLSMMASLAFSSSYVYAENVLSADNDGIFWIEESDCDTYSNSADGVLSTRVGTNGTAQETADMMSGGDAYWAWWGGTTYTATYKVNASEAGTYKLWYRGSDPTNAYHDKIKLEVNDTLVTVDKVKGTDFTATIDPSGTKKNFACAWFVAEVTLSSGVNTIEYYVNEKSSSGAKYACLFDCMVLAPSTYTWANPSVGTKPITSTISFGEDGVAWIEESNWDTYSNSADGILSERVGTNGTAQATADMMSGGDAYWAWWGGTTYSATYKVNAPETGTYKLWYRGSDPTGAYHDKSKITVNGTEVTVTKVTGTDFTATIDPSGTKKNFACGWFVAEVSLTSGINTIEYYVNEKSSSGAKYACLFDCMVLAPSIYDWTNPTLNTRPKYTTMQFDEDGVAWIEENDCDTYSNSADGVLSTRVGTNGTAQETADMMSGGDAYWAWWGGTTYDATYKVNAPEAGTYKLWYRGSDPTGAYHDKSRITVNGTEVTVTKVEGTSFTATIDPSGTKKNFSCGWFVAEVILTSGINIIEYYVNETATSGGKYSCLFDCMVLAPSIYDWTTPTLNTRPKYTTMQFDEDGVAWIEENDCDTYSNSADGVLSTRVGTNGTAQETADMMSGGDAYWAWWSGTTYSATYKVNAPKAGRYKLWYRGSDPTNEYSDTIKIEVNDALVTVKKVEGTDFTAKVDPSGTPKNFSCAWFWAEVILAEGVNTIEYYVNEKSSKDRYVCLFDCMVLAPSTYVWVAPTTDTLPQKPERLVDFLLDGSLNVGDTEISLTVYLNEGAPDMDTTIIPVLYKSDNSIKHIEVFTKSFTAQDNEFNIPMTSTEAVADGDLLKVFIWDNFENMTSLSPKLTLGEKIYLAPWENSSFHKDIMESYLNDSYENVDKYINIESYVDRPNPIRFKWSWIGTDEAPIEYKLSVSESPEMTNAKEYITSAPYCEVLNLKSGTDYYWTVSATDRNGNDVVSGVAVSKTSDKAPRNIFINGVRNARDVGGWTTTDGTVVKQGLLYRSGRLDQITQEGIRILHDDLKIKTEIDFRRDTEERVYEDETPIGEDVQYFRFPMEYGDYLTTNVEAIKNIFNVLSDESNYPIIYHCAAGADRTGVVTYLINGLLGVPQEELFRDFLLTNFGGHERDMSYIEGQYVKILNNYDNGQGTLQERIYKYLNNEIGVPAEQLDFVIEFLK